MQFVPGLLIEFPDALLFIKEQGIAIKFEDEQEVAIQAGYESELKTSIVCDLNYPPPVTRRTSRQELTEVLKIYSLLYLFLRCFNSFFLKTESMFAQAEKEERRMRRVLANRESAKRTIHRRQVCSTAYKFCLHHSLNEGTNLLN